MRWILHLVPVKIIILESSYNWFKIDILRLVRPLTARFSPVQGYLNYYIQGGFFDWSALKMTKCQPLKEFSELVLLKND